MSEMHDPNGPRELVLHKQAQRWVFRYAPGDESGVLHALAQAARDPRCAFDWFDAAVLSHQMGEQMQHELKHMMTGWSSRP